MANATTAVGKKRKQTDASIKHEDESDFIDFELEHPGYVLPSFARRTQKGGYAHTSSSRRKIGEANKGNIPWNKGKNRSEEAKAKIGMAVRARNQGILEANLKKIGMTQEEYNKIKLDLKYVRERVRKTRLANADRVQSQQKVREEFEKYLKQCHPKEEDDDDEEEEEKESGGDRIDEVEEGEVEQPSVLYVQPTSDGGNESDNRMLADPGKSFEVANLTDVAAQPTPPQGSQEALPPENLNGTSRQDESYGSLSTLLCQQPESENHANIPQLKESAPPPSNEQCSTPSISQYKKQAHSSKFNSVMAIHVPKPETDDVAANFHLKDPIQPGFSDSKDTTVKDESAGSQGVGGENRNRQLSKVSTEQMPPVFKKDVHWDTNYFDDPNVSYKQSCPRGGPGGLICCSHCSSLYSAFLLETQYNLEDQQILRVKQEVECLSDFLSQTITRLKESVTAAHKRPLPDLNLTDKKV